MINPIVKAIAQEAAHGAESAAHGPWYSEAENWVAVAFVIFVIAVARPLGRAVATDTTGNDKPPAARSFRQRCRAFRAPP